MGVPNKKVISSNDFFTEKVRLEEALIEFEKLIMDATTYLDTIDASISNMQTLAEENESAYFLQRVKKLHVFFNTLKLKKGYSRDDFEPIYHVLSKIKNEDRIEFLDSALKNRISKVAKSLAPVASKKEHVPELKDGKDVFTAFKVGGVYFLIPKRPYKILKNLPAFKSSMILNSKRIPLFPGRGFLLDDENKNAKKNVILIQSQSGKQEGFYFDELLEDWAISKESLQVITEGKKSNQKISGTIKRKGINYHLIKLESI